MNIYDFNSAIHEIRKTIDYTSLELEYEHTFTQQMRKNFNQKLRDLECLLKMDAFHSITINPPWHTARRIVALNEVVNKLEQVRDKIFKNSNPPYFVNKIKNHILPIQERIKNLKIVIGQKGRLPFSVSNSRQYFYQQIQDNLNLKNLNGLTIVQKEFFHLMGNYFEPTINKEVNVDSLNGNQNHNSLESWKNIMHLFIDQAKNQVDKEAGDKILKIIEKTIPVELKTSYLRSWKHTPDFFSDSLEIEYYKDLIKLEEKTLTNENFQNKYLLNYQSIVPFSIAVNEVAWDHVDIINQLTEGECALFTFGSKTHSVAIEITCRQKPTRYFQGNYIYKIFNTGTKCEEYHNVDLSEKFSFPLIYEEIPSTAFSYQFFLKLLDLKFESFSMEYFYKYHKEHFNACEKTNEWESPYLIQKFGTCTYSAIEAWIEYKLTKEQKELLRKVKIEFSMSKQWKLIRILKEATKESSKTGTIVQCTTVNTWDPKGFLKDSEFLYDLGRHCISAPS